MHRLATELPSAQWRAQPQCIFPLKCSHGRPIVQGYADGCQPASPAETKALPREGALVGTVQCTAQHSTALKWSLFEVTLAAVIAEQVSFLTSVKLAAGEPHSQCTDLVTL